MDAGRVLATGTPAAILAGAGAATLEEAFIAPAAPRRDAGPPRSGHPAARPSADGAAGDRGARPDQALRRLHGGRPCRPPDRARRDLRLPRLQRLRQDHDHEDADRPAAGQRRRGRLFGQPVDAQDIETRRRVGYMSQAFSLYAELTVRQNLELHARLFRLPRAKAPARVARVVERFELDGCLDACRGPAARPAPAPVARGGGDPRAGAADPRRADLGRRSGGARRLLGAPDRSLAATRGHDLHLHPLHERGGALRPHLAHACRPGAGERRAGRAGRRAARPSGGGLHRLLEEAAGEAARRLPSPARPRRRRRHEAPAAAPGLSAPAGHRRREAMELLRDRSGSACPARHRPPDGRHRLRHQHGRREPDLRRARPGPDATSRAYVTNSPGSRYFVERAPICRLRRPRPAPAQRRAQPGPRDPARLRARHARAAGRWRSAPGSTAPCRCGPKPCVAMSGMHASAWLARWRTAGCTASAPVFALETRYRYNPDVQEPGRDGAGHHPCCCC